MMAATGGVNTHRGAIFALGLAIAAWSQSVGNELSMQLSLGRIAQGLVANSQIANNLPPRGAIAMALTGYRQLFQDWLPYYRSMRLPVAAGNEEALQRLLLRIMSTLDDTCIMKRAGEERAQLVKKEARQLLDNYAENSMKALCNRYAAENISPGGAADMLSLTIFIDSII